MTFWYNLYHSLHSKQIYIMFTFAPVRYYLLANLLSSITKSTLCLFSSMQYIFLQKFYPRSIFQKAVARKASEGAMKVPEDCTPVSQRSWSGALKFWIHQAHSYDDDPCTKYHETFMVDPILDVSPLEVSAVIHAFFRIPSISAQGDSALLSLLISLNQHLRFPTSAIVITAFRTTQRWLIRSRIAAYQFWHCPPG